MNEPAYLSRDYQRLWDLVRSQRANLLDGELITHEEYAQLAGEETDTMGPGCGSPSARRLESYDEMRAELTRLKADLRLLTSTIDAVLGGTR